MAKKRAKGQAPTREELQSKRRQELQLRQSAASRVTGKKRGSVGYKNPPLETRFSSENQPARRRGPSIVSELLRQLDTVHPKRRRTMRELVAAALVEHAAAGNAGCMKILLDRCEGPVPVKVEGDPAAMEVRFVTRIPDEEG